MEEIVSLFFSNIDIIIFGIVMNVVFTFAFGIYKTFNLNYEQTVVLIEKYPVKTKTTKLLALWFIPWIGFLYIFYELFTVQKFLNSGLSVYDYLEHKLQIELDKQNGDMIE